MNTHRPVHPTRAGQHMPVPPEEADVVLPPVTPDATALLPDPLLVSDARSVQALLAVTDPALAHLPLDTLGPELLRRICQLLPADSGAILLLTEARDSLVVQAALPMSVLPFQFPWATAWRASLPPVGRR